MTLDFKRNRQRLQKTRQAVVAPKVGQRTFVKTADATR